MEKKADCAVFNNTRDIIQYLNSNRIPREDVVTIMNIQGQLFLIYYK